MKVKLRKKPISKGRKSYYLDFWPPVVKEDGKSTRREFLGLYIYNKPKTEFERYHNKETNNLAEAIRAQRQIELQNKKFDFINRSKNDTSFLSYFKDLAEKRKNSNGNYGNWISTLNHLEKFTNNNIKFADLTEKFCRDFKEYLLNAKSLRRNKAPLSQNSMHSYFNKFRAAIKQALDEGFLNDNPLKRIKGIPQGDTERQFLTIEELDSLVKVECELPYLKRAALFSALTGLRHSDIEKLKWSEIQHSKDMGHFIRFRQQKTKSFETLNISAQARDLLGDPKNNGNSLVFTDLKYSAWQNQKLKNWIVAAGIKKDITFHCFRHTYATLQLSLGTDITTVQKMLGHKNLKTTGIYAKVVDLKKLEAASKINLKLK